MTNGLEEVAKDLLLFTHSHEELRYSAQVDSLNNDLKIEQACLQDVELISKIIESYKDAEKKICCLKKDIFETKTPKSFVIVAKYGQDIAGYAIYSFVYESESKKFLLFVPELFAAHKYNKKNIKEGMLKYLTESNPECDLIDQKNLETIRRNRKECCIR